jgi:hypothetical protein
VLFGPAKLSPTMDLKIARVFSKLAMERLFLHPSNLSSAAFFRRKAVLEFYSPITAPSAYVSSNTFASASPQIINLKAPISHLTSLTNIHLYIGHYKSEALHILSDAPRYIDLLVTLFTRIVPFFLKRLHCLW